MSTPDPTSPQEKSLQDLLREVTWDEIVADGVVTLDEIDAKLRAKGFDPDEFMYLYE